MSQSYAKPMFNYFLFKRSIKNIEQCRKQKCVNFEGYQTLTLVNGVVDLDGFIEAEGSYKLHEGSQPVWFDFAKSVFDVSSLDLKTRAHSLIVIFQAGMPIKGKKGQAEPRLFAVTMGRGWQAIDTATVEPDFGKVAALNWMEAEKIMLLRSRSGGKGSIVREEVRFDPGDPGQIRAVSRTASIPQVGGKVKHGDKEIDVKGGRAMRFPAAFDFEGVIKSCRLIYEKYLDVEARPTEFSQFTNVMVVDSDDQIRKLWNEFHQDLLGTGDLDASICLPDGNGIEPTKLQIMHERKPLDMGFPPTVELLRGVVRDHAPTLDKFLEVKLRVTEPTGKPDKYGQPTDEVVAEWPLARLFSHVRSDGDTRFILDDGTWHSTSASLLTQVEDYVKSIKVLPDGFLPEYSLDHSRESEYNSDCCKAGSGRTNLDLAKCRQKIGRSDVEFADIYTSSHELLHVKRDTDFERVNTVCGQAVQAARCLAGHDACLDFLKESLPPNTISFERHERQNWTFVVALVADKNRTLPEGLSFRAKLALEDFAREVRALGFSVAFYHVKTTKPTKPKGAKK